MLEKADLFDLVEESREEPPPLVLPPPSVTFITGCVRTMSLGVSTDVGDVFTTASLTGGAGAGRFFDEFGVVVIVVGDIDDVLSEVGGMEMDLSGLVLLPDVVVAV
jgi:hypothetical protein